MAPPWIFSHLVMIQPKLGFGFLEALFYCPPDATQPDEGFQSSADKGIADVERVRCIFFDSPLDDEPDGLCGQTVLRESYSSSGKLIFDGAFCSFGNTTSIPENIV